jgi:deoxyribonuclease-4
MDQAVDRAKELGCDTFQIFTRNPRGWKFGKLKDDETNEFKRKLESYGLTPVVAHMPYLPNLSTPKKLMYNKSVKSLIAELDRCSSLNIPYVVTHLGSHLGKGPEIGLTQITAAVNQALSQSQSDVMLLLENTAGTKNSMGSSFEDIKRIVDRIEKKNRIGVCFDTAHAFAAGYDLRTPRGVEETIAKFDTILDLDLLKVIHLNDSKVGQGSGRDRHEHVGTGYIGIEGFKTLFRHPDLTNLPFIMETPETKDEAAEIRRVRALSS